MGSKLHVEPFRALDTERRQLITGNERLKAERNQASDEIARLKKSGQDASAILARMKEVSEQIKHDDERVGQLDEALREFLLTVPNIPHSSVPVGKRPSGQHRDAPLGLTTAIQLCAKAALGTWRRRRNSRFDFSAVKIAGARFAVYKQLGARLERAIANFFLDMHTREHGYTEISRRLS